MDNYSNFIHIPVNEWHHTYLSRVQSACSVPPLLYFIISYVDTALVADSEEKLGRLVSEFGRVCERRKLRVNVGKNKVMRCSRYGNGDRMHVILNGGPLEEVDYLRIKESECS